MTLRCSHRQSGQLCPHPNSRLPFVTPPASPIPPLTVHVKFCLFLPPLTRPLMHCVTTFPFSLTCGAQERGPLLQRHSLASEVLTPPPFLLYTVQRPLSAPSFYFLPLIPTLMLRIPPPRLLSTITPPSCSFLPQNTLSSSQLPPSPHSAVFLSPTPRINASYLVDHYSLFSSDSPRRFSSSFSL